MPTTIELSAQVVPGADYQGYFQGRFLPTAPGNYEIQLQVPGTPEIIYWRLVVKESNPELDNTRPDFAQLRQTASDAALVYSRMTEDARARLKAELQRTNRSMVRDTGEEKDALRLFFDLKSAELIPTCIVSDRKTQRSRGPVRDIWDEGMTFGNTDAPLKLSTALLVVVGLLSLEWLTRKLLKLA
jgi:hypothetical protein